MSKTLEKPVLVMNRAWQPVQVVSVQRALIMLAKEAARVVNVEDYQLFTWEDWAKLRPADGEDRIKSLHCEFRVPEVIVLCEYSKLPKRGVVFSRRNVYRRDDFTCQLCGKRPGSEELTIDHVVPRAQGGVSSWTNCVLACTKCNATKRDRTPEQAGMKLKKQPTAPTWKPLYADSKVRLESWSKFISESYWAVPLEK